MDQWLVHEFKILGIYFQNGMAVFVASQINQLSAIFSRAREARPPADCSGTCRTGRRSFFANSFSRFAIGVDRWRGGGMELEQSARTLLRSALVR
jgi:hypothetical protein